MFQLTRTHYAEFPSYIHAGPVPRRSRSRGIRGSVAQATFLFSTCFVLGAAISLQAAGLPVIHCDFESNLSLTKARVQIADAARITHEPDLVPAGRGALECDTTTANGGWCTFLTGAPPPGTAKKNAAVLATFRYRVVRSEPGAFFTHFWHSASLGNAADRGVLRWRAADSDQPLYAGKVFGLPRQGRIRVLAILGDADDYQLKLAVHGKACVIIDDLTVSRAETSAPGTHPPALLFPEDRTTLSPEAVQFVWNAVPPAVRYQVQYSRSATFHPAHILNAASARQRHYCRRLREGGTLYFTNFFEDETAFPPEDLSEGRWFWRVRAENGVWSTVRSFFISTPGKAAGKTIHIGPENPLLILYWHHGPTIDRDWPAVPVDIRPRCMLRVRMGKYYSRRSDYREVLDSLERSGARGLVQIVQWNIAALPLPLIEDIFRTYPAVVGVFVAEFTEGLIWWGCPPQRLQLRDEYLRRLLLLTKRYGGTLFLAEKNNHGARPFLRLGASPNLFKTFRDARDNVCLMWKQNSAIAPYLTHASVLGLWFAGACRNWGVATEAWYWFEAGFGALNQVPTGERIRPTDYHLMPASFLGTMMLLGAASGAAVYELECPVPIHKGDLAEAARDVVIPLFRRLVDWRLVPTREEVRRGMPVAYLASKDDVQWSGRMDDRFRHGRDMHYGRLKPLFASAYGGLTYFAQMIPRGPHPFVPVLPALAPTKTCSLFQTLLTARDLADSGRLKRVFAGRNIDDRPRGTAFCAVVGRRIYACNPWENRDKACWIETALEKPFVSIRGDLPVHCWLAGVQRNGKLMLHLNGRPGKQTHLWIRAGKAVKISCRSAGTAQVDAFQPERGGLSVSVRHANGWCDLLIAAVE